MIFMSLNFAFSIQQRTHSVEMLQLVANFKFSRDKI